MLSFLALNVSKINFFQPTRPVLMFCKIEWFGRFNLQQRLNNCGFCDIASARKTLVEGNDKEDSCEEKKSVEIKVVHAREFRVGFEAGGAVS